MRLNTDKHSSGQYLKRILTIIAEIKSGSHPNSQQLADLTGIHERSIKRDLRVLREEFNAPIQYSRKENGFYFAGDWQLSL